LAFVYNTKDGRRYISHRPQLFAREAMVSAGHHLASQAGLRILQKGGNAIDAGVATGLCLCVLQSDYISFLGVAPIMIHLEKENKTISISGVGRWPKNASIKWFNDNCSGEIPPGVSRAVVPAAPDSWLYALEHYGTMNFSQVAEDAIVIAEQGFAMYHLMYDHILTSKEDFLRWEATRSLFFTKGKVIPVGHRIFNKDLANTFKRMVRKEENFSNSSRELGIRAARDEIYVGEVAREIVDFVGENGGLLDLSDLSDFHVKEEEVLRSKFQDYEIFSCGPWSQGPVFPLMLNILENLNLPEHSHNSVDYLHKLLSSFDLAFADREAFIGDPEFVDVPIEGLLSKDYASVRSREFSVKSCFGKMPNPGNPWDFQNVLERRKINFLKPDEKNEEFQSDTSFCTVIDSSGNVFSATPSDSAGDMPFVPGVGATISSRGSQSWLEPDHPSAVAPLKRPRLTPNPVFVFKDGRFYMSLGTPGGDVQAQAMAQVFLNHVMFGMELQMSVEVPRVASYNFPNSFWPHAYIPGSVKIEESIFKECGILLGDLGYQVSKWRSLDRAAGSVCCVMKDHDSGFLLSAADPRRESYSVGW
tara:strand:- start:1540 stop:3303 length:1764 start_codon:yes stop_codon:yes gene_type:complete